MTILSPDKFELREFQQAIIKQITENEKSVGLVLPTAAGKTLIAISVADHYYSKGKILFLVPNTQLGNQHLQSVFAFTNLTARDAVWLSGAIKKEKRPEYWMTRKFFIATPQTAWNDINNGTLDLSKFSLIIFDEMHLAGDEYDYVNLARRAKEFNIVRLGLTASPGGNLVKIERIQHNLGLDEWCIRVDYDAELKKFSYPKVERRELLDLTPDQKRYEMAIMEYLNELFIKFMKVGALRSPVRLLSEKELEILANRFNPRRKSGYDQLTASHHFSLVAEYYKLRYLLSLILTTNYYSAWEYLMVLRKEGWPTKPKPKADGTIPEKKKPVQASRRLCQVPKLKPVWLEIKAMVTAGHDYHPKLEALLQLMVKASEKNAQAIIFCNDRKGQAGIMDYVTRNNSVIASKTAMINSESTKRGRAKNQETLTKFTAKEIEFLISTSILEAGVHLPEVDYVVNYSIPLEENTTIQRRGRVGRTKIGHIYYLAVRYPMDLSLLFANAAKITRMQKTLRNEKLTSEKQLVLVEQV